MFWRGSSRNSTPPKQAAGSQRDQLRRKQIETLLRVPNIQIVVPNSVYSVSMQLGSQFFGLRISLPVGFPENPPVISTPPCRHPWVSDAMNVVGHPRLAVWNPHNNLGTIVNEVIAQFKAQPPVLLAGALMSGDHTTATHSVASTPLQTTSMSNLYASPQGFGQPGAGGAGPGSGSASQPPSYSSVSGQATGGEPSSAMDAAQGTVNALPPVPDSFPQLEQMTHQELQRMMDDSRVLDSFYNELPYVKASEALHTELTKSNEELAQANINLEKELKELTVEVEKMREQVSEQTAISQQKMAAKEQILERFSAQNLSMQLAAEASELNRASEDLVRRFVQRCKDVKNGGGVAPANADDTPEDLQSFVDQYCELRRQYHRKQAKVAALQHPGNDLFKSPVDG